MARRLLQLNGIAILGVIVFHATGFGFTAMFSWAHRYRAVTSPNYEAVGSVAYYAIRLMEQAVASFCVPAFLFVSGFSVAMLAGRTRPAFDPGSLVGRIRHLLVPYLVWSAVVFAAFAVLDHRILGPVRYLRLLLTGGMNPNYYFVPLLIQLYLVSPLLIVAARWNWKLLLAVTGLWQLGIYAVQYVILLGGDGPQVTALALATPKWLFLVHIFWFAFGIAFALEQRAFKAFVDLRRGALTVCAAATYVLGVVEWEVLLGLSGQPWLENRSTIIDGLYAVTAILCVIAWADGRLPRAEALSTLGSKSYGIYLVHGLAMEYFARGLYHAAPWVLGRQAIFQPLVIAVGMAVPLVLMDAVNRSPARRAYAYVFG